MTAGGRESIRRIGLVLALLLGAASAFAATSGLTEADYRYLRAQFGLARDSFTLSNISPADAAKLHQLIDEPQERAFPNRRYFNVADYLFDVEMRTCQAWALAHATPSCPQVTDESLKPGWELAERRCIACHLTGTTSAPSFFKLAQSGTVTKERLSSVLEAGHRMSPVTLSADEIEALARYINSLRVAGKAR